MGSRVVRRRQGDRTSGRGKSRDRSRISGRTIIRNSIGNRNIRLECVDIFSVNILIYMWEAVQFARVEKEEACHHIATRRWVAMVFVHHLQSLILTDETLHWVEVIIDWCLLV